MLFMVLYVPEYFREENWQVNEIVNLYLYEAHFCFTYVTYYMLGLTSNVTF